MASIVTPPADSRTFDPTGLGQRLTMLGHFGMQFAFPGHEDQTWSAAPSGSLSDLNTIANDFTQPAQRRAEAVFGLFAHHVSCGMTAADMGKVLGANTWLSQASLDVPQVLGGVEPVNTEHGTWVQMDLFSGDPAMPHWIVHFSLEGDGEVIDARRFFEGSASVSGFTRIEEVVLDFPHPYQAGLRSRRERFTRWFRFCKGGAP